MPFNVWQIMRLEMGEYNQKIIFRSCCSILSSFAKKIVESSLFIYSNFFCYSTEKIGQFEKNYDSCWRESKQGSQEQQTRSLMSSKRISQISNLLTRFMLLKRNQIAARVISSEKKIVKVQRLICTNERGICVILRICNGRHDRLYSVIMPKFLCAREDIFNIP